MVGNTDGVLQALKEAGDKLSEVNDALGSDANVGGKRKREEENSNDAKRQKISPEDLRRSGEAKTVHENIMRILRANKNRLPLETLTKKLDDNHWNAFAKKHPGTELKSVLEYFGDSYSFEIRDGKDSVRLNPPMQMGAEGMFPFPGLWGSFPSFAPPPFPPTGESFGRKQKKPRKPKPFKKKTQPVKCDICDKVFNSQKVYETHLAGKKHAKKVKLLAAKDSSTAPAKKETAKPAATAKQVANVTKEEVNTCIPVPVEKAPSKRPAPNPVIFFPYRCLICDVPINSKASEELHIKGKRHKKATQLAALKANKAQPGAATAPVTCPVATPAANTKATVPEKKTKKKKKTAATDGFKKYQCEYCKVDITSKKMEETHVAGKKHLRKKRLSVQQDVQSNFQDARPNQVSNEIWQVPASQCW